jgi:hypothetical protein
MPAALLVLQVLVWRSQAQELPRLKDALSDCQAAGTKTREINDELQKERERIAARLTNIKRLHANRCLAILSNADAGGAGHARVDGVITGTTDDFREYAARCNNYRSERIALERLLK